MSCCNLDKKYLVTNPPKWVINALVDHADFSIEISCVWSYNKDGLNKIGGAGDDKIIVGKSLNLKEYVRYLTIANALINTKNGIGKIPEFTCGCGWQGASDELKKNGSLSHADTWYECPSCSGDVLSMKRMSRFSENVLNMNPRELENGDWAIVLSTLVEAKKRLNAETDGNHTWLDGSIEIAKSRSETSS